MWAVDVPAFMIQAPPCLGLSGKPVDCVVAPGTAIIVWCGAHVPGRGPPRCATWIRTRASRGSRLFPRHEHRLRLGLLACRLRLQILRHAVEVGDARALHRERLLLGKAGPVVADQAVSALPERFVA